MGWGFRVACPDCGHEWTGIETSFRFGPWSMLEDPAIGDSFRSWFCPRCYYRLYIPRAIERNVWRKWYAKFLAGLDGEYAFLHEVASRLDGAMAEGRFYTPLPVELEPIECPGCHQPLEESSETVPDRLVCPRCGGRGALLDGFYCHCQMLRGEPGLA